MLFVHLLLWASQAGVVQQADGQSAACSSSSSPLAAMPEELLTMVVRNLSTQQRFGGCAATCRKLLTAAVAATEELQLCNIDQQRADSIALWLAKHSSKALLRLSLEGSTDHRTICSGGYTPVELSVPYDKPANLQQLALCRLALPHHPASSSSSSSFSSCFSSFSNFFQLASLPHLQRLELTSLQQPNGSNFMGEAGASTQVGLEYGAGLGLALGQLVQLTALGLSPGHNWRLTGLALTWVSDLTRLRQL
jgi:hypothetical protein